MSISTQPHYEISASELAAWIEQQGADRWWNIDGDPLLTGRVMLPCPGDRLAAEFRRINRPLLVWDKHKDSQSLGQLITREQLDALTSSVGEDFQLAKYAVAGKEPVWWRDRRLFLRWKGADEEWLLIEDTETTKLMREEALVEKGG